MPARSHLDWPFLDQTHRALAARTREWCATEIEPIRALARVDGQCRKLVRELGRSGLLASVEGGSPAAVDVRAACVVREVLAEHWGLADFAFAMQGLGSAPIRLFGSDELRRSHASRAASGEAIGAFAISEAGAGSDLAAISTTARRDGDQYVLDGEKMWISNAGIADFYVVFARTGEAAGARGLSAFVVDAATPGLDAGTRVEIAAPHPLGTLRFHDCRVGAERMLGAPGRGITVALGTLDVFRATVGAAAVGFARRALREAVGHAGTRAAFGTTLSELEIVQAKLADMAVTVDASALLVYRAAWTRDVCGGRVTREAAMAKYAATEGAQRVIDGAIQILGARGLVQGSILEELYREIRPLRIYEGASEVQQVIIARSLFESPEEAGEPA
jgi:acyl-CoA dehydrogenase